MWDGCEWGHGKDAKKFTDALKPQTIPGASVYDFQRRAGRRVKQKKNKTGKNRGVKGLGPGTMTRPAAKRLAGKEFISEANKELES